VDPVSLQVFGEQELVEHLARGGAHYSHCISIRNPDERMPGIIRDNFRSILELRFYDAEEIEHLGPAQTIKRIPERRDVKGVVEFFRLTAAEATGYTIHCWQGISRSPAVALGLLYLLTGSEDEAAWHLKRIRPDARPHRRLVKLFDEQLGCRLAAVNARLRGEDSGGTREGLEPPRGGLLTRAKRMRPR
jgi:predicted protein tyrosine phosphatase